MRKLSEAKSDERYEVVDQRRYLARTGIDDITCAHHANPYAADQPTDTVRVMTQRQLNRLIYVAAEVGSRFGRREVSQVTSSLFAPLPLFDDRPAHSACVEIEMFLRAIRLHKTAAPPRLTDDEINAFLTRGGESIETPAPAVKSCGRRASLADFGLGESDLFTATVVDDSRSGHVHIFAAFLAVDEQEACDQLEIRLGSSLASSATLRRGFDPSEPIAASLLSDAVADALSDIARDPSSSLAAGFDLFVEHRFAN